MRNSSWTHAENALCFYELKEYIEYVNQGSQKSRRRLEYAEKLIRKYPLFNKRSISGLRQHLDYLYRVSIDDFPKDAKDDEKFRGLLLEYNIFESNIITENIGTEVTLSKHDNLEDDLNLDDDHDVNEYKTIEKEIENSSKINLTDVEKQSLLSFIGHGEFNRATIAIFGNEGGLGGQLIRENIDLLCKEFKENKDNYLDGENWESGYWHTNEFNFNKNNKVPNSPFLYLTTRIILALENKDSSVEDWFKKGDSKILNKVKTFIANGGLFSDYPGLKSALFDWRPLPRRDEKAEYFPYLNVDSKSYLNAFALIEDPDNPYNEWVEKRITMFKNILHENEIPVILSFGALETKIKLFKKIWPEIEFNKVILEESNKVIYVSREIDGFNTTLIATEFLDYQNLGYVGTKDLVKYIKNNYL